jgi:hypothetical protein
MAALADAHVHKTVLKSKTIAESGLLPDYVKPPKRKEGLGEGEILAMDNVTARLYNTKAVKENMSHIMTSVYAVTGIPNPANKSKQQNKKSEEKPAKKAKVAKSEDTPELKRKPQEKGKLEAVKKGMEPAWEGFDSGSEEGQSDGESIDFSKYEGRLAGSSDEESESDEDLQRPAGKAKPVKKIMSRGISVSVSGSDDEGEFGDFTEEEHDLESASEDDSDGSDNAISRSPPPSSKKKPAKEPPKPLKAGSQFLPTLMGGYWSGSEESASDVEEELRPVVRKNRPGQMARRAIWEKKFGARANHIQNAPAEKEVGDGWDARRGARGADDRGQRGRGGRGGRDGGRGGRDGARGGFGRRAQVTGENASELGPRKARGAGKKDDVGVLHPSWAAAKKAKEEKKVAKFEGKKVVFD